MKIHIIIIFFSVILGASCEKSESQRVNYGSILLESIHFSVGGETIPLSRAVDAGLQVQIRQNGVLLEGQDYAPGTDFSKRITLPVGENYTVKAFTPDQTEAGNDEPGHPVYSVESEPFEVIEGDITTLSLTAPQINVGVAIYRDFCGYRVGKRAFGDYYRCGGYGVSLFYIAGFGKVELHCPGEESGWRSDAENFRFVGRSQKL